MYRTLLTVNGLTIDDPDNAIPSAYVFDEYFQSDSGFFNGWYDSDHAAVTGSNNVADWTNRIESGPFAGYHFAELAAGNGPTLVSDVAALGLEGIGPGFMNGRPALRFNADSVLTLCQPEITTPGIFQTDASGLAIIMAPIGSPATGTQNIASHSATGRRVLYRASGTDEIRHTIDDAPNDITATIAAKAPEPLLLMAGWTRDGENTTDTVTLSKNGGAVASDTGEDSEVEASQINLGGGSTSQKQLVGLVYAVLHLAGDPHRPENQARKRVIEALAASRYGVPIG